MKYTAEITNKDLNEGRLIVQVRYVSEDSTSIVQESYSTRSGQDPNWLQNNIDRKLRELEELDLFVDTIELGVIVPGVRPDIVTPNTAKEVYKQDLERFNKLVQILRQGFVESDNAEFVALQAKLKQDFSSDYIDLF